jgi:hypothetical protein
LQLIADAAQSEGRSRPHLIAFTSYSMRLMEIWRQLILDVTGTWPDYESTMILGAVISIRGEKLLRSPLADDLKTLCNQLPQGVLSSCNVSSVAEAVGLNRETVRRRIGDLIGQGLISREADGALGIAPGLLDRPEVREALKRQLEFFARIANQLVAMDLLIGTS